MHWELRTRVTVWAATAIVAVVAALNTDGPETRSVATRNPTLLCSAPLAFAPNEGQWDADALFVGHARHAAVFLTADAAVLKVRDGAIRMRPTGGAAAPQIERLERLPGLEHYFIGNDRSKWRSNLPTFAKVVYRDVLPGIDWVCRGTGSEFEYDFVVAPGADASLAALEIDGADSLRVDEQGDLHIALGDHDILQRRPRVFEITDDGQHELEGRCVVLDARHVRFDVAGRDPRRTLVVDPITSSFGTYVGGSDLDFVHSLTHLTGFGGGAIYYGGGTLSSDLPHLFGGDLTENGDLDAFVAEMNPITGDLSFTTYVGGSGAESVSGITFDPDELPWFCATTTSTNYPTTAGVFGPAKGTGRDGVVTQLPSDGHYVFGSTYLGTGSGDLAVNGIAIDDQRNVFVCGTTGTGFAATAGVFQTAHAGADGTLDAFVQKMDGNLAGRTWATYLGGSLDDSALSIAVDAARRPTIVGRTLSSDFPRKSAAQDTFGGVEDGFVARLGADAKSLDWSTFVGGTGTEQATGVVLKTLPVDQATETAAVVVGLTGSSDLPVPGGFQTTYGGGSRDAFVAVYHQDGTLARASFLGGSGDDAGFAIHDAYTSTNKLWLAGLTASPNFPAPGGTQTSPAGGTDAFVVRLATDASSLEYGSLVGGTGDDYATDVTYVPQNELPFLVGETESTDLPTTDQITHPEQRQYGGGRSDGFVSTPPAVPAVLVPPGAVDSYFLPRAMKVSVNAKSAAKSKLSTSGFFDTGSASAPDFESAATLDVGDLHVDIPGLVPKGKTFVYSSGGLTFTVTPNKTGSSRAKFRLTRTGDVTGLGLTNGDVALQFENDIVSAKGTIKLTSGYYRVGRARGALVAPAVFPVRAKAKIAGAGKDALFVLVGMATNGQTPAAASDVEIAFGSKLSVTILADQFTHKAGTDQFTFKGNVGGITAVTVDYLRETISIKGGKLDLGTFVEGANTVAISVGIGDDHRSVVVRAAKNGATLTY